MKDGQRLDSSPRHREALHDAVERYHRPLVGYARHLLGDAERARDAAQDTLLRMCQQDPAAFERDIQPRLAAWLFTVCRNRAIDMLRKDGRMQPTEPTVMERHADAHGAGRLAEERDTSDALMRLVQTLPDKQREVVQLRFHGQLAYKQIAEVTGHSVSHVGVLLHEAIKTLRQEMTRITA